MAQRRSPVGTEPPSGPRLRSRGRDGRDGRTTKEPRRGVRWSPRRARTTAYGPIDDTQHPTKLADGAGWAARDGAVEHDGRLPPRLAHPILVGFRPQPLPAEGSPRVHRLQAQDARRDPHGVLAAPPPHAGGTAEGDHRPERSDRAALRRDLHPWPLPARGRARPGEDPDGLDARPDSRRRLQAGAVHARPDAVRHHGHQRAGGR